MGVFDRALGERPHQRDRLRADAPWTTADLLRLEVPGGQVTEAGLRTNVSVALQYLDAWLQGNGAAAIFNLMEDAATAEISRSQLWHWLHRGTALDDGRLVEPDLYRAICDDELTRLGADTPGRRLRDAAALLDRLALADDFPEFLTLVAYPLLH